MTATVGERLATALSDRYRVERELGAGGMATVYLAHDVKHEREVAIKVLHPDLGAALGAERFLAEIKTTAKLQHPHILPLLDSGAADGLLYYVMPYVKGETLRARLEREKQLPIADAVRIAREVAGALDHAHKQGVIHRDIKPENILLQDGAAVVADFGIALAVQSAGGQRMTQTGLSLGTPQYMSPEQAMGERAIDARSDIYALGAVTYEMLCGEPPFAGASVQSIVAKVLTEKPVPPRTVRDTIPRHVEQVVLEALAKLPVDRPESARQFADMIGGATLVATTTTGASPARVAPTTGHRRRVPMVIMAAITGLCLVATAWLWGSRTDAASTAPRVRLSMDVSPNPQEQLNGRPVIAPDGHAVAFAMADTGGRSTLRVRRLDSAAVITIEGTEGAVGPLWSPDSRWIAYFVGRTLYRVKDSGGRPERIADVGEFRFSGDWLTDDLIVVSVIGTESLLAVSVGDQRVREFYRGESDVDIADRIWHVGDGQRAIVRLFSPTDTVAAYRYDLVDATQVPATRIRRLQTLTRMADGLSTGYMPRNGRYVLQRENDLWVNDYDPATMELTGERRPLVTGENVLGWDASAQGDLVFTANRAGSATSMLLLDRSGQQVGQVGATLDGIKSEYYGPRYSPDGRSVAYEWHNGRTSGDLWRMDLSTMRPIRQTRDEVHHNAFVAWTADGRQLVFESTRDGGDLYVRDVDGATDRRVPLSMEAGFPSDWSPDGGTILFGERSNGGDVYATTPRGDSLRKVLGTDASEMQAVFSPDGKWIAYASDEQNRRFEIFLRRWPVTDEKWVVSNGGGDSPRWRGDGKELFFLRYDSGGKMTRMMAVDVTLTATAPQIGTERLLFRRPLRPLSGNLRTGLNYDVRRDGQQFVVIMTEGALRPTPPTLDLYLNWRPAVSSNGSNK
ncbi:MAG: protein kinase [Gemmatimonas sp.]|nr:protein kinase [Gemmatimonas sp.]